MALLGKFLLNFLRVVSHDPLLLFTLGLSLDEAEKAQFVGNFFHWVKCRFSDCNSLAQKNSKKKADEKKEEKTEEPKAAESEKANDPSLVQTDAQIKTEADSEKKERIVTNNSKEVQAELDKERHDIEMKQSEVKSDNSKDTAPE